VGRPAVALNVRALIRHMRSANPLWGAPRLHGELRKLGVEVSQTTVAKYIERRRTPPSPTWRTFLTTHVSPLASIDFFTVPTATFRVLFVLIILSHNRRRVVYVNVTDHPTATWTRQQIREAFPDDCAPRYLLRDRDGVYGPDFGDTLKHVGIEEVVSAPRSPWQNPFVERLIGTIRRECLDHVIVWNERSLRRTLRVYLDLYHRWRTHLALDKDAPEPRITQSPKHGGASSAHTSTGSTTMTNAAPLDRRVGPACGHQSGCLRRRDVLVYRNGVGTCAQQQSRHLK